MEENEISQERQDALALARKFGWQVIRKSKTTWEFSQPDTGGLWDVFRIPHKQLDVRAVLCRLEAYDEELGNAVWEARCAAQDKWFSGGEQSE